MLEHFEGRHTRRGAGRRYRGRDVGPCRHATGPCGPDQASLPQRLDQEAESPGARRLGGAEPSAATM
jgi:hypothetical protein